LDGWSILAPAPHRFPPLLDLSRPRPAMGSRSQSDETSAGNPGATEPPRAQRLRSAVDLGSTRLQHSNQPFRGE
ncbi:hypothetical protein PMAYCL1PPCAC_03739, partial [Pristionchus mayeri]